mmetsp:Transcript_71147/g.163055  ORF Transcript_71147/g.163055 Transcript_71147/m.163055 type:complete len:243 (+) Transcript_71147:260-988(+)
MKRESPGGRRKVLFGWRRLHPSESAQLSPNPPPHVGTGLAMVTQRRLKVLRSIAIPKMPHVRTKKVSTRETTAICPSPCLSVWMMAFMAEKVRTRIMALKTRRRRNGRNVIPRRPKAPAMYSEMVAMKTKKSSLWKSEERSHVVREAQKPYAIMLIITSSAKIETQTRSRTDTTEMLCPNSASPATSGETAMMMELVRVVRRKNESHAGLLQIEKHLRRTGDLRERPPRRNWQLISTESFIV